MLSDNLQDDSERCKLDYTDIHTVGYLTILLYYVRYVVVDLFIYIISVWGRKMFNFVGAIFLRTLCNFAMHI